MNAVEIPAPLIAPLLYRARLGRRSLAPGTAEHHGHDVADLAEYWAGRLFDISLGRLDDLLTLGEVDELRTLMTEVAEAVLCDAKTLVADGVVPDVTEFQEDTEKVLAFLGAGE